MSSSSASPQLPDPRFARQHQARRRLHATQNRNLLMYSTAAVRALRSCSVLMVYMSVCRLFWESA